MKILRPYFDFSDDGTPVRLKEGVGTLSIGEETYTGEAKIALEFLPRPHLYVYADFTGVPASVALHRITGQVQEESLTFDGHPIEGYRRCACSPSCAPSSATSPSAPASSTRSCAPCHWMPPSGSMCRTCSRRQSSGCSASAGGRMRWCSCSITLAVGCAGFAAHNCTEFVAHARRHRRARWHRRCRRRRRRSGGTTTTKPLKKQS